jgi:4-amino-4-deoxy-L-arabinose transferase-like glycosyltransferase
MSRRSTLALTLIVLFGFGVRIAYLIHATSQPRYEWVDPDHYKLKGARLAGDGDGWRWSFDAVRHSSYDQRFYVLPPAYPVFLSLFALFPGYPFTAQVGQVVLSTVSILLLFFLGRQLHSERAGLIAAAIYAAWLPNVIAVWSTMQEALYVPLVLAAFVLLLRAVAERDSAAPWGYGAAGAAFGLATLTRSMPMYALPVLAALVVWRERRRALAPVAALFAGFLLLTIPYSAALSHHLGRATFVENHGSIFIIERYGGLEGDEPASLVQTATILVGGFVDAPRATLHDWWRTTRSVLHVNGGRLLQIYLGAATETGALVAKIAAHLFGDVAFVACLVLAPIGLVLCRRPYPAAFVLVWIVVNVGLVALSGFGGPRLRAPIEPHLIALAAVVLAGGFRVLHAARLAAAALVSGILATIVVPQLPASFAAEADYGVHWPLKIPPKRSAMTGTAGFNVLAVEGVVRFHVRPRNPSGKTEVEVRLEGELSERVRITEREHRFELAAPSPGLVHVELVARDPRTGEPVPLFVIVPRPA